MKSLSYLLPMVCAATLAAQTSAPSAERHLLAAQQAQAAQDCHTAALEYAQAAKLMPANGELRSNEGVAQYCGGQYAAAARTLKAALTLNHSLAAPHMFLGLAAYHLGDPAVAITELRTFLRARPGDQTALLWLGYALAAQHQYEEAVVRFETVLATDTSNADAEYALGETCLEIGRQKARQLEILAPGSPRISQLAGEQYRLIGDEQRAAAAFAQQRNSESSESSSAQQDALYQAAHDAELRARKAFEALATQSPDSYRAHQVNAESFLMMQNEAGALAEYRTVATLNPTLPGVHEAIGNCLFLQARFQEALTELQLEENTQPHSSKVAMELGRVKLAMGDDQGAAASLDQAMRRRDPPAETHLLLARAAMRANNNRAAVSSLKRYLSLEPDAAGAWYLLARAYRKVGDAAASSSALATYQRLSQHATEQQLTRAITHDPQEAATQLTAAELQEHDPLSSAHP